MCDRGAGFNGFSAPQGAPDAGVRYPQYGPCRILFRAPSGAPRGIVIQIAGGGWRSGPRNLDDPTLARQARVFLDAGFQVATIEHTSGAFDPPGPSGNFGAVSFVNVYQWYDLIRYYAEQVDPNYPICLEGGSSAGHLALLVDVVGGAPDCVITEGAPTQLAALPGPARGAAVRTFGEANLGQWSPATYPSSYYGSRILMGHLPDDRIVQAGQMYNFVAARPSIALFVATPTPLPPGVPPQYSWLFPPPECQLGSPLNIERIFTHMCSNSQGVLNGYDAQRGITASSIADWRSREMQLLSSLSQP